MNQVVYVASPDSQQIHVWQLDSQGELTLLQRVEAPGQVQPMVIAPDRRHLYVGVRPEFAIVSYRIDAKGKLEQVGMASLPGSPTHIATDRQGRFLFSASYSFNCVSVSPIDQQGIVGAAVSQQDGLLGCHSANIAPDNQLLLVPCLKEDRIRLYQLSPQGQLTPHSQSVLDTATGAGPRHMVFHPHLHYAYCINELDSSVDVYQITEAGNSYRRVQTLDSLPTTFDGTRWAADIHISPDGRNLYTCDRTASLLSVFRVSEDGSQLRLVGHQPTEAQPRGFAVDHSGRFVIAAGQKSDHIAVYRIDETSGELTELLRYPVGQGPMWVSVLQLDA